MSPRVRLALFATGLSLSLTGCSRLDWAVRFADTYLMMETDRFVDLSSDQRKEAKAAVQTAIKDVRKDVFPEAADFLEEIDAKIKSGGLDRAKLDAWFERGQTIFKHSLVKFEAGSLNLAKSMTPEQDKNFAEEFKSRIDELEEETSTPEKALKRDRKRASKWADQWIDGFTSAQEKKLEDFLKAHPTPYDLQLKNRRRLFEELKETKGEARAAWIKKFLSAPEEARSPEYAKAVKEREGAIKDYLLALWSDMNDDQKKTFSKTLKEKAATLRDLSNP